MIDLLIACYQRNPIAKMCLDSIEKWTKDYNLILIEGKRSAAENRNIGLKRVKSDWFAMMDDDVVVTPGWLDTLMQHRGDGIGQIQPKLLFPDGRIFGAEKVFTSDKGHQTMVGMGEEDKGQYDYVKEAEMLSGTCGLYNSRVLDAGCRFDEAYKGSQFDDIDWSMQILKAGFKLLYCGKAAVYHYNLYRRSFAQENFEYFRRKWFASGMRR